MSTLWSFLCNFSFQLIVSNGGMFGSIVIEICRNADSIFILLEVCYIHCCKFARMKRKIQVIVQYLSLHSVSASLQRGHTKKSVMLCRNWATESVMRKWTLTHFQCQISRQSVHRSHNVFLSSKAKVAFPGRARKGFTFRGWTHESRHMG